MNAWLRGASRGLGYSLAVTALGTWIGAATVMEMRLPVPPLTVLAGALLSLAQGALLGLAAAPLLRLQRYGAAAHTAVVLVGWLVFSWTFALNRANVPSWLVGPLAGLVLLLLGLLAARRVRWLPWATGAVVLLAAVLVPGFVYRSRAAALSGRVPAGGTPRGGAPDVVVVVLDTVRAASTSAYGYERVTTPEFDRIAAQGALFLDANAPATWSLPSHASLFTGRFPSSHQAHDEHPFLTTDHPTLAEALAAAGYETRCFTANAHISGAFGLTRGFAWSDESWRAAGVSSGFVPALRLLDALGLGQQDKGGGRVAENFEKWLAERSRQARPAFAFVNFLEAHFPYHEVPREYLAEMSARPMRELRAASLKTLSAQFGRRISKEDAEALREPTVEMYDAGVRYTDHLLGRIVAAISRAGRLDDTILVVLADHGEMVGERGYFGHEGGVHQLIIHVPLLVRFPPRITHGTRVSQPISTLGVFATILDLAGLAPSRSLEVGSLMPALDGRPAGQPVITEQFVRKRPGGPPGPLSMADRRYRILRSGSRKLVVSSRGDVLLFDLATDPGEDHDLARQDAAQTQRLRDELQLWEQALGLPALDAPVAGGLAPRMDPEAAARLRALGYAE